MTSRLHASHDIASAHTKGPWSFTRYGYEKHAIADDRGTEIGFVHRARDARLIAAAPELFEALEELVVAVRFADPPRHFGKPDDEPNICHEARIPTDFVTIAERALAKARGEQVQP